MNCHYVTYVLYDLSGWLQRNDLCLILDEDNGCVLVLVLVKFVEDNGCVLLVEMKLHLAKRKNN